MVSVTPDPSKQNESEAAAGKEPSLVQSAPQPTSPVVGNAAIDLTALSHLDYPGVPISSTPGVQIDDPRDIRVRDLLSVRSVINDLGIGPESRVLISVPAGNNNRYRNSPSSLLIAHRIIHETPAEQVTVCCRIDDKEMNEEHLPLNEPEKYSEFKEFFGLQMRQGHTRLSIAPLVQPQNTSQYEAKLAIREAIEGGYSHLILPTHAGVLGERLLLASRSEQKRHSPQDVPGGLRVSVLNHGGDESLRVGSLEKASLMLAQVAERYFPDFMDKMALKEGLPGKLYGLAQAAKVSFLKRGIKK